MSGESAPVLLVCQRQGATHEAGRGPGGSNVQIQLLPEGHHMESLGSAQGQHQLEGDRLSGRFHRLRQGCTVGNQSCRHTHHLQTAGILYVRSAERDGRAVPIQLRIGGQPAEIAGTENNARRVPIDFQRGHVLQIGRGEGEAAAHGDGGTVNGRTEQPASANFRFQHGGDQRSRRRDPQPPCQLRRRIDRILGLIRIRHHQQRPGDALLRPPPIAECRKHLLLPAGPLIDQARDHGQRHLHHQQKPKYSYDFRRRRARPPP